MQRESGMLLVKMGSFLIVLTLLAKWYGLSKASGVADSLGMAVSAIVVLLGLFIIYRSRP